MEVCGGQQRCGNPGHVLSTAATHGPGTATDHRHGPSPQPPIASQGLLMAREQRPRTKDHSFGPALRNTDSNHHYARYNRPLVWPTACYNRGPGHKPPPRAFNDLPACVARLLSFGTAKEVTPELHGEHVTHTEPPVEAVCSCSPAQHDRGLTWIFRPIKTTHPNFNCLVAANH